MGSSCTCGYLDEEWGRQQREAGESQPGQMADGSLGADPVLPRKLHPEEVEMQAGGVAQGHKLPNGQMPK